MTSQQRIAASSPPCRTLERTSTVPRLLSRQTDTSKFARIAKLRLVPIKERIDGTRWLLTYQDSTQPWPWRTRFSVWFTAIATIVVSVAFFVWDAILEWPVPSHVCIVVNAVSCTLCGSLFFFMQPQLLRRLVNSFDWAFVSLQLTVLHVCASDMFAWDRRALVILTAQYWLHFVLAADALTPQTRHKIGFHRIFSMFVTAMYAGGTSLYLVKLVFDQSWELHDRIMLDWVLFGHHVRVRVVPMTVSRLPMIIVWSFRLLWRLYMSTHDELIFIQGAVAYDRHNAK